jgi:hypothetical protein
MRRRYIPKAISLVMVAALSYGIAFLSAGAHTQSTLSKRDIGDLIYDQLRNRRLTERGSPPFHVLASIRYTVGSTTSDGTYELLWADRNRFREEFRLGQLFETDVAMDGKRYVARNTVVVTYPLWWIRSLMSLPLKPVWAAAEKKRAVRSTHQISPDLMSVKLDGAPDELTVTVDLARKEVVSEEIKRNETDNKTSGLFDKFTDFGSTHYPMHVLAAQQQETVEVTVSKIEAADSFADTVFMPPANATAHDWCADPDIGKSPPGDSAGPIMFLPIVTSKEELDGAQYFLIGIDGRIEELHRLFADGSSKKFALDAKYTARPLFQVHECDGKPIEYETVIQASIIRY